MKPKAWIVGGLITLGLVPLAWWAWRHVTQISAGHMSPEYLATAEFGDNAYEW